VAPSPSTLGWDLPRLGRAGQPRGRPPGPSAPPSPRAFPRSPQPLGQRPRLLRRLRPLPTRPPAPATKIDELGPGEGAAARCNSLARSPVGAPSRAAAPPRHEERGAACGVRPVGERGRGERGRLEVCDRAEHGVGADGAARSRYRAPSLAPPLNAGVRRRLSTSVGFIHRCTTRPSV
jgi:hypothetical protein